MVSGLPDCYVARVMGKGEDLGLGGKRLGLESQPRDYLKPGQEWPDGQLVDDAPPEAYLARSISRKFREVLNTRELSVVKASEKLGMSTHTIHDLLNGKSWARFSVIARIEHRFNVALWSTAHKLRAGQKQ